MECGHIECGNIECWERESRSVGYEISALLGSDPTFNPLELQILDLDPHTCRS